ncbi:MAG TPA: hypothetical protein VMT29_06160 [Steroidobacteraceae bacterium]|nr:hypothetical protein [Steroidobacteraceae bacterium]
MALALLLLALLAWAFTQESSALRALIARPEPPVAAAPPRMRLPRDQRIYPFKTFDARPSAWFAREQELFTAVLDGAGCDVLVVPFEAKGRSVDRPARSLMARMLAAEIVSRTGLCVADLTLVSRALGSQARAYEWPAIAKLADAVGARHVIRGEVNLALRGQAFELFMMIAARDPATRAWSAPRTIDLDPIVFSDDLAPEAAFAPRVRGLSAQLALPAARPAHPAADNGQAPEGVPADPRQLAQPGGSAVERAQRLQALAAMLSADDVSNEHLWERSLIALLPLPATDQTAQVLRARANLHLHRRPYALKLLQGIDGPQARLLHALADGNLPQAVQRATDITDPFDALVAALDLEDLRQRFGSAAMVGYEQRRADLISRHNGYAALLYAPMSSGQWFHQDVHLLVAAELARDGLLREAPAALFDRLAAAAQGDWQAISMGVAREIEDSYPAFWRDGARAWRAAQAFDRLAAWDFPDALYWANRQALSRMFGAIRERQGRPRAALDLSRTLAPAFRDYAPIEAELALALQEVGLDTGASNAMQPDQEVLTRAAQVYAWEGEETLTASMLTGTLGDLSGYFYRDEPPRPWRPAPFGNPRILQVAKFDNRQVSMNAEHYRRSLAFTQHQVWYLERAYKSLTQAGRTREAAALLEQNRDRFVGHPSRAPFLAERARDAGDAAGEQAILQEAIGVLPDEWSSYLALASAQLRARQAQAAQRTLLSFPQFRNRTQHPVSVAHAAREGGMLLRDAGEIELARPLLELCVASGTGAASEMWSAVDLSVDRRDYRAARDWTTRVRERYAGDEWAQPEFAMLSFLTGASEAGWRAFDEASHRQMGVEPWIAASVGHRIAGSDDARLVAFAETWRRPNAPPFHEVGARRYFLFDTLLIDRPASESKQQTLAAIGQSVGDQNFSVFVSGYQAVKRRDFEVAARDLVQANDAFIGISVNVRRPNAFPLPYMALALTKTGKASEAQALVASARAKIGRDFYTLLAQAVVDAHASRGEQAAQALWEAFLVRPNSPDLLVPPLYELLEVCEMLMESTNEDRYRALLVDLARRGSLRFPRSWSFAFLAKYAPDPAERQRALGIALYLDRRSERLSGFSTAERTNAASWFAQNNPFLGAARKLQTASR